MQRTSSILRTFAPSFAAVLFLFYAVVLFVHSSAPPLTDYANWTYQGVLLHAHMVGITDPAHRLKHYPVPNSMETLGIGLLTFVLPWVAAAKAWLCVQFALGFFSLLYFARTIRVHPAIWFIAPGAIFLNVNFWYGFMNFELALCWVILFAAMLLRRAQSPDVAMGWDGPLAAVLVLAFLTHMIPCAFCCLLLLLYVRQTGRWTALVSVIPVVLLTCWYTGARYFLEGNADGQTGMQSVARTFSVKFWAFKCNSYLKSFGLVNPNGLDASIFGRGLFLVLLLVTFVLAVLMGWMMVRAGRAAFREKVPERFLWLGVALTIPVFAILPSAALGISDPGARLLQTALALGIVLACGAEGRGLVTASICSVVLSASGAILFAHFVGTKPVPQSHAVRLPQQLLDFDAAPYDDQDFFYDALDRGDLSYAVFPTGVLINQPSAFSTPAFPLGDRRPVRKESPR
jgi:hypothetical protein